MPKPWAHLYKQHAAFYDGRARCICSQGHFAAMSHLHVLEMRSFWWNFEIACIFAVIFAAMLYKEICIKSPQHLFDKYLWTPKKLSFDIRYLLWCVRAITMIILERVWVASMGNVRTNHLSQLKSFEIKQTEALKWQYMYITIITISVYHITKWNAETENWSFWLSYLH